MLYGSLEELGKLVSELFRLGVKQITRHADLPRLRRFPRSAKDPATTDRLTHLLGLVRKIHVSPILLQAMRHAANRTITQDSC